MIRTLLITAALLATAALGQDPAQRPAPGGIKANPKDGLKYVYIPPGTFRMGCAEGDKECNATEQPAHQVKITKGFWLSQTETTQAAYERLTGNKPSAFQGGSLPVEGVTWDEAGSYCKAIGGRLPTDAEWEYAARGGSPSARYGEIGSVAWYDGNSGGKTHEVGQKLKNGFGLYDMLGNVNEWTADWSYFKYDELTSPGLDPKGPSTGNARSVRGGGYDAFANLVRASVRIGFGPRIRNFDLGFRCIWEQRFP